MRKYIVLFALVFLPGFVLGQTFKKGNILGFHLLSDQYELKPGVTLQQLENYYLNDYIPSFNQNYQGVNAILLKGVKGTHVGELGLILHIESQETFDEYFSEEAFSNPDSERRAQMAGLQERLGELVTQTGESITDWMVLTSELSVSKGNVLGVHMLSDMNRLASDVTIGQVEDFYVDKFIPAFNRDAKGIKTMLMKGIKGDDSGELALIMHMESTETLNDLFTEKSEVQFADLSGLQEELNQLMTQTDEIITDWEVLN